MRLSLRISRHVAREVAVHAAVGLAAVGLVFVARNLLRYGTELMGVGASPGELGWVLGCVAVASLTYALPIAFLFGVLAGVARLAEDRETLGLRACGVGLLQLGAPVLALAALVSGLAFVLALDVEPRAKRELRSVLAGLAQRAPALEPGRFTRVGAHTLWVGGREGPRLERVFAADRSRPERPLWAFAERGETLPGAPGAGPRLRLLAGDLHVEGQGRRSRIAFEALELPLAGAATRWPLRPKDLSTSELRRRLALPGGGEGDGLAYAVQLHRRLALPLAPLLFTFTALPLALGRRGNARSWGFFCCVGLVLAYYALLAGGQHLALAGLAPAAVGLWAPNTGLALAGAGLALRASRLPG